jgi:hypothetical protein
MSVGMNELLCIRLTCVTVAACCWQLMARMLHGYFTLRQILGAAASMLAATCMMRTQRRWVNACCMASVQGCFFWQAPRVHATFAEGGSLHLLVVGCATASVQQCCSEQLHPQQPGQCLQELCNFALL